jgi:hypothetical protein
MADSNVNPDAAEFVHAIENAQQAAKQRADLARKLHRRLSKAKKVLSASPAVDLEISKLIADLRAMPAEPEMVSPSQLIDTLEGRLRSLRTRRREQFPAELRHSCESRHLEFVSQPEGFGVGPFYVAPKWPSEKALFQYGKIDIGTVLLDPMVITEHAISLKEKLFLPPPDPNKFAAQLHEAMRVVLARQDKDIRAAQLRVELPLVYREISLIRQSGQSRTCQLEYSIPRFVVELKQFIQSEHNIHAPRQFRLEAAVIENTKNPQKSFFIPDDLARGYGEGSYYQTIVFA